MPDFPPGEVLPVTLLEALLPAFALVAIFFIEI